MPLSVPTLSSQFYWLNWRNAKLMYRNPMKTRAKLVITIILALLLGLIYFDLPQVRRIVFDLLCSHTSGAHFSVPAPSGFLS
jgi:hypothetical protein